MTEQFKKYIQSGNASSKFSILIPSWRNLPYLKNCIESIRKNSNYPHQIIVFLNEYDQESFDYLSSSEDIDFIASETNVGICYSMNIARQFVKSDYIIYMNDDMYVLPEWDIPIAEEIEMIGHNMFMLSATMIEPYDSGNPCVVNLDFGNNLKTFQEANLLKAVKEINKEDWNGSTWPPLVLHKDIWDLVGGFSIEFSPGMYSDPDLSKKVYDLGVRYFKGIGKSLIYHFGKKSTSRLGPNFGKKQFTRKWKMTPGMFSKDILDMGGKFHVIEGRRHLGILQRIKVKIKVIFS